MSISHIGGQAQTTIQCPFCNEIIEIAVDLSQATQQEFVYDCEVCCRPINVRTELNETEVLATATRSYD